MVAIHAGGRQVRDPLVLVEAVRVEGEQRVFVEVGDGRHGLHNVRGACQSFAAVGVEALIRVVQVEDVGLEPGVVFRQERVPLLG